MADMQLRITMPPSTRTKTLKAKLRIGGVLSVLVILVLSIGLYASTARLRASLDEVERLSGLLRGQGDAEAMLEAVKADVLHTLMVLQEGKESGDFKQRLYGHVDELETAVASLGAAGTPASVASSVAALQQHLLDYRALVRKQVEGSRAALESGRLSPFLTEHEGLSRELAHVGVEIGKMIGSHKRGADAEAGWINAGLMLGGLLGLAGIGALAVSITSVSRRLDRLVESVQGIADDETDLSRRLDIGGGMDEVGIAARALNQYLNAMNSIVDGLRQASTRLHAAVGNMNHLAGETREQVVAAGGRIHQATASVARIATAFSDVADAMRATARSTVQADEQSQAGSAVVSRSVAAINALTEEMGNAARSIDAVHEQSQRAAGVVQLIREVAAQTSMLALNAAIEAARAGESGRGFAVVADEVRELASRTHTATGEITSMIEQLQAGAEEGVLAMRRGMEGALNCRHQTGLAGDTFGHIASAISEVSNMGNKVSQSAEVQRSAAEGVSADMHQVNESAQAAVELSYRIMQAAAQAEEVAEALESTIMRFRTGDSTRKTEAVELF